MLAGRDGEENQTHLETIGFRAQTERGKLQQVVKHRCPWGSCPAVVVMYVHTHKTPQTQTNPCHS